MGQVFDGGLEYFTIDAVASNVFQGPPFTMIFRAFGYISGDKAVLGHLWNQEIGTAVIGIIVQNGQICLDLIEDSIPIQNIETEIFVQGLTQQIKSFRSMVSDSFTLLP